jgi:hypothetical protein
MGSSHRVVRRPTSSAHSVQLFDEAESIGAGAAAFLLDGWRRGEPLLVVARPERWLSVSQSLAANGCAVAPAMASGRLVVLNAAATVASLLEDGVPARHRFDARVGSLIGRFSERFGPRLRVYGEMVDILAAHGEFASAQVLEQFWNDLGRSCSFSLLCGYASAHFSDPGARHFLRDVCVAHSHAYAEPADLLANWLLAGSPSRTAKTACFRPCSILKTA